MDVQCELCPKMCVIRPGQSGDCRVRINLDGRLLAVTYGHPCAVHVDPVEKKPLFHFLPGSRALSLATAGCNLHCKNCQNWEISQQTPDRVDAYRLPPQELAETARQYHCASLAYTYSEPLVFYEYTLDGCRAAREKGLKNILVTAGYINRRPLLELCRFVDAITLDLKAYSDKFYREICGATLAPVLNTLVTAKDAGVMVEVSNLLLPTLNDSDADIRGLTRWVRENMGPETPFHFLRFYPRYLMRQLPPTSAETLERARNIAAAEGLKFVYVGDMLHPEWAVSACPGCGRTLIRRDGFTVTENKVADGKCPYCGRSIYGIWR